MSEEVAEELIAISELLQQVHELERELAEQGGWEGDEGGKGPKVGGFKGSKDGETRYGADGSSSK